MLKVAAHAFGHPGFLLFCPLAGTILSAGNGTQQQKGHCDSTEPRECGCWAQEDPQQPLWQKQSPTRHFGPDGALQFSNYSVRSLISVVTAQLRSQVAADQA
jgi:hypothetical protein